MTIYQFKGLAHWLKLSLQHVDLVEKTEVLIRQAQVSPAPELLMDLSILLQMTQQLPLALQLQHEALQVQQVYLIPTSQVVSLRVLLIVMTGELMQNTPLECLLDNTEVQLSLLFIGPGVPLPENLPDHDILFIGVGESERSRAILSMLQPMMAEWHVPVVNQPLAILNMARSVVASNLQDIPHVCMPTNKKLSRYQFERMIHAPLIMPQYLGEETFPFIIRPINSHAGIGLERLNDMDDLIAYLARHQEAENFYLAPFVDYSNEQGVFCKYRIALVNGEVFVCHVAMSHHWMIHYANAGMYESAEKRALEAQLMTTFEHGFKQRHAQALAMIHERVGLEYFGIDCAELANGDLLIFEVDTSMVVHAFDPIDIYPYKQAPMRQLTHALVCYLKHKAIAQ